MAVTADLFAAGVRQLALPVDDDQRRRMLAFLDLLARWNKAYNLTAVRDPAEMVTKHLLDSLTVLPHVVGPRVLDVGSGGGLPGIPLAIALPEIQFTLLDSNGKKARFLTQAGAELGIGNLSVVHSRVEQFAASAPFDTITSRAFASVADFAAGTRHLLAPGGRLLAMKGTVPEAELAELPAGWQVEIIGLTVPGLAAERHLVRLTPAQQE